MKTHDKKLTTQNWNNTEQSDNPKRIWVMCAVAMLLFIFGLLGAATIYFLNK